tara:strand:- start:3265 stop:3891 length:627 start_codon:yes stop_codon:yes gene_type:complete
MKKTLPFIAPQLNISENVAIIGSAGNLRDSSNGELIDQFEDVIRFNRAPVKGYESDVGSKTTLRVTNNHVFNNNDSDPAIWSSQPRHFIKNLRDTRILYFAPDYAPWLDKDKNIHSSIDAYVFDYDAHAGMKKVISYQSDRNLTVGMGFITLCLLAGIKPHLFGFSINSLDPRDHYWEKRPPASETHSVSEEKKILTELKSTGIITVH